MIKKKCGTDRIEVEVRVRFIDGKGNEVTKYDKSYDRELGAAVSFIGMMLTCGSASTDMVKDLGEIAVKAMGRAVASGFVPLEHLVSSHGGSK